MKNKPFKYKKPLYIILGLISLALAYIGVIMPGIPGTPFIILTAWFFVRSSDNLFNWLLKNKLFARIIKKFREGEISWKVKLFLLLPVWISFIAADLLFVNALAGHILFASLFVGYTILILLIKSIKI